MEQRQQGLLGKEPVQEVEEHMVSEVNLNNTITEEEREEMLNELTKLEEEIVTLKQVLASKEMHHAELKHRLGMTTLTELKQNLSRSWNDVQSSTVYKKTSETLSTAGQKTTEAFSNLGTAISRKFGDMSYSIRHSMSMPTMRNSESFKSFEEKVESTVSSIKSKVGGNTSGGNFNDVLSSAAQASAQNPGPTASANDLRENNEC
ncbi:tumor protein D53 isoform X3 [Pangasianodon hypophthalmus]|uniref:tumor protein D53 isoform X3 n=1 Tax=Pangasianodon hypophthalmus TaxID=310915 RepID=UPI000EFE79CD|nr:tumor protein D53 isoform X3 [Pangasianodon hypophthalmus]